MVYGGGSSRIVATLVGGSCRYEKSDDEKGGFEWHELIADASRARGRLLHEAAAGRPTDHSRAVIEDTMFFPKLRRHAKWMFVFLALIFASGFIVFGVGSDVQGGIGDIFRDGGVGTDTPSVEEARERVAEQPNNAEALRDLATALTVDAQTDEAIEVLNRYTALRPKDEDALRELAGLHLTTANRLQGEAELTQQRANYLTAGATFTDPLQLPGGATTLAQDPIVQAITTKANAEVNAAYTAAQEAYRSAADTYDKIVVARPDGSEHPARAGADRAAIRRPHAGDRRLRALRRIGPRRSEHPDREAADQAAAGAHADDGQPSG